MRKLLEFRVEANLPKPLEPLRDLANNLWWTWNPIAMDLFRRIDDVLWETTGHNPVLLLNSLGQKTLNDLASDATFLEFLERVLDEFHRYQQAETWFSRHHDDSEGPYIAYFSMEFGLTECLPLYSGGLGVLSGDHMKSSSDLGLPLVGVSLLFQKGYFEQYLNADGWQQERNPTNDFFTLPIQRVTDGNGDWLRITLPFPGRELHIQVWQCKIGRTSLFLLDTNLPENSREDQNITDQLYGGDQELRIQQEIVLGIGGIRALHAMGIHPKVHHINEGHAAFLGLERIRLAMLTHNLSFREARVATGGGNVFTTHTPVPAGFDIFPVDLMTKYFSAYVKELGMSLDDLLRLGRRDPGDSSQPFNMAIMAGKTSTFINGVSKLHAKVTRAMVANAYEGFPLDEIPIGHVTNGVHLRSWISADMAGLFDRYLGSAWINETSSPDSWKGVERIPNSELWRTHERRRERLVAFARRRLREQLIERGASQHEIMDADEVLDPEALTIGFARRFATYKRATLLFHDRERLRHLLTDQDRPLQIIFAGKAHPHDDAGKELIRDIIHFARQNDVRHRIVFLENYNMNVARYLVQGVDVWLNTPRRPMEASGTSGMKVAANGGLNLSILDGWWAEGYTPNVGWAIGHGEEYTDPTYQDDIEAHALYALLEDAVVPMFYTRGRDHLPREWIAMMKTSLRQLVPYFSTDRMLREYCEKFYLPAKDHYQRLAANEFELARTMSEWRRHVARHWSSVAIESAAPDRDLRSGLTVGDEVNVSAVVQLGQLRPQDVLVEMYVGPLDEYRRIRNGQTVEMQPAEASDNGRYRFSGTYSCTATGNHGLGIRIIPFHELLATKYEMGRLLWA